MAEPSPKADSETARIPWLSREGKFRFELGLRQNDGSFFASTPEHQEILSARQKILAEHPTRHAALLDEGRELLTAARLLAQESSGTSLCAHASPFDSCLDLGRHWEPDFLLLKPDIDGALRLVGGCVCFPSSWDLTEKLGKPVSAIHEHVPTLNASLGAQIDTFLRRIKPGVTWERWNWGLAAVSAMNHHPALAHPRLSAHALLAETWIRIEHQAFRSLDVCGSLLFAIRISVVPLSEFAAQPLAASRLVELLETMPEHIARYKGLSLARPSLIRQLRTLS